ncbi:unnamed protein product [Choristocarpus tenellus]
MQISSLCWWIYLGEWWGDPCWVPPRRRRVLSYSTLVVGAVIIMGCIWPGLAQYVEDSPKFNEQMAIEEAALSSSLEGGDYVENYFFPERQYEDTDVYEYDYPDSSDYTIGIIIDPCKSRDYNCCHRFFGSPEYTMMSSPDETSYRIVDKTLMADSTEVLANVVIVDKDGVEVDAANSRLADDEIVIDDICTGAGVPHSYCAGFRQKMQRSSSVPPCLDNNQTVNGMGSCQDLDGIVSDLCLAVGYSQTAISVVCGGTYAEDDHCGTFLEIHMGYSNYNVEVEEVLAERRVENANTTGYTTTTISLSWKGNTSMTLCDYEHTSLLVGTMVLIAEDTPICCCPKEYSQMDSTGSYMCPVYNSQEGPLAILPVTVSEKLEYEESLDSYPFCPYLEDNEDLVIISEYSKAWNR